MSVWILKCSEHRRQYSSEIKLVYHGQVGSATKTRQKEWTAVSVWVLNCVEVPNIKVMPTCNLRFLQVIMVSKALYFTGGCLRWFECTIERVQRTIGSLRWFLTYHQTFMLNSQCTIGHLQLFQRSALRPTILAVVALCIAHRIITYFMTDVWG